MATVAIDVDDTLYCFNSLSRQIVTDMARESGDTELIRAAYAPWTEWRTPADLLPNGTWLEVINRAHTDEMIREQTPFRGVYQTLWGLIDSGHDIIYISNRAESSFGSTAAWIEQNGFPHAGSYDSEGESLDGRVQLVCTTGSKHPYVSDCKYIIDDRPKTLVEFVYDFNWKNKHGSNENPRKGFGLHREYNGALTDVPGVYLAPTWNLLESYLVYKGIITAPYLARV